MGGCTNRLAAILKYLYYQGQFLYHAIMACVEGRYFASIAAKFRMCGYMAGRVPWFGQWSHGPISRCYLEPLHHLLLLLRLRCFGIRDGVNGDDMVQCWLHLLILPWRDMELMDGSTARGH
jgi:hypothetical protein